MAAAWNSVSPSEMELMRKCLRLLYSNHPDSATDLRLLLDEQIKQRYGPEKMLCNMMSKQQLAMEKNFPGMVVPPPPTPAPQPAASTSSATAGDAAGDEVINLTNSPKTISDSPATIIDSDDEMIGTGMPPTAGDETGVGGDSGSVMPSSGDDDGNLKEFGDLNCCVCGEMMFTATNRLIECSKCGALYHQDCHKPPITEEEASEGQVPNWQCDTCFNKPSTSRAAGVVVIPDDPMPLAPKLKSSATSSRSSSSSNSSSPFYKQEATLPANSTTNTAAAAATTSALPVTPASTTPAITSSSEQRGSTKHHHHKSSSKGQGKEERSSSRSSAAAAAGVATPALAAVAASEKSSSSSTTSSSSSSSKKPTSHSSSSKSSKSSKHHESSKRKK